MSQPSNKLPPEQAGRDPVFKALFEQFAGPPGQGKGYFVFNWTMLLAVAPFAVYLLALIETPTVSWALLVYSLLVAAVHIFLLGKSKDAMARELNPFSFVSVVLIYFVLIVVYLGMAFTFLQRIDPSQYHIESSGPLFLDMIYFSFVSVATVGYGDIHPTACTSKLLAISEILIGIWFLVITLPVAVADQVERIRHFRVTQEKVFEEMRKGVAEGRWQVEASSDGKPQQKSKEPPHSPTANPSG